MKPTAFFKGLFTFTHLCVVISYITSRNFIRHLAVAAKNQDDCINTIAETTMRKIINFRDLSTYSSNLLPQGVIYRSGAVTKADHDDANIITNVMKIQTFIDLRGKTEFKEDHNLNNTVFRDYTKIKKYQEILPYLQVHHTIINNTTSNSFSINKNKENKMVLNIPLISEKLVAWAVFKSFTMKEKLRVFRLLIPSLLSKTIRSKLKKLFVKKVNQGGLKFLYEIIINSSGEKIVDILKVIATPAFHPVWIYCTAGKDRTGIISMFISYLRGVSIENIIKDYTMSRYAYNDMNDSSATIASLKQDDLDVNAFYDAPKEVIIHIIQYIQMKYGSIEQYLDKYGFDTHWRKQLQTIF